MFLVGTIFIKVVNDICQEMFGDVFCLLMLIFIRKLKKACLFYLSDTYVWIYVF